MAYLENIFQNVKISHFLIRYFHRGRKLNYQIEENFFATPNLVREAIFGKLMSNISKIWKIKVRLCNWLLFVTIFYKSYLKLL